MSGARAQSARFCSREAAEEALAALSAVPRAAAARLAAKARILARGAELQRAEEQRAGRAGRAVGTGGWPQTRDRNGRGLEQLAFDAVLVLPRINMLSSLCLLSTFSRKSIRNHSSQSAAWIGSLVFQAEI